MTTEPTPRHCPWCDGSGERTHPGDGGGPAGECSRCEGAGTVESPDPMAAAAKALADGERELYGLTLTPTEIRHYALVLAALTPAGRLAVVLALLDPAWLAEAYRTVAEEDWVERGVSIGFELPSAASFVRRFLAALREVQP